MRQIMNISLPADVAKEVRREVKNGEYISVSEFFRAVLRDWREEKLLRELRVSQRDAKIGKGKVLRSLKDLR
jgi:Arc/MetJ-type ribon-helix-helix transcriptional regulator